MNSILGAVVPFGEWHVITCFDTLLFYDFASQEIRHGNVASSRKNLLVVSTLNGIAIEIRNESESLIPDISQFCNKLDIEIKNAGFYLDVYLRQGNMLGSARPDGSLTFNVERLMTWEMFRLVDIHQLNRPRYWEPSTPQGGTQLIEARIRDGLAADIDRINLRVNSVGYIDSDVRPLVVWFHNQPNPLYDWCNDAEIVGRVSQFVFVSYWQLQKFIGLYCLPPERCRVIKNAILMDDAIREWPSDQWRWRCAYISAPFRGLDVLVEAWRDLSPANAELHVWSGEALWNRDETNSRVVFAKAMETSNIFFHRVAPNSEVRLALRDMHFLLYPCTYDETSCISVIEAMAAGCRVIAASRAALPETAAGFARLYPSVDNFSDHKKLLTLHLVDELRRPWQGQTKMAIEQQEYCRASYGLNKCIKEWHNLIDELLKSS